MRQKRGFGGPRRIFERCGVESRCQIDFRQSTFVDAHHAPFDTSRPPHGVGALMGVPRRSAGRSDFAHERHHNDREREAGANSKVGIGKRQHQRLTIGQQP